MGGIQVVVRPHCGYFLRLYRGYVGICRGRRRCVVIGTGTVGSGGCYHNGRTGLVTPVQGTVSQPRQSGEHRYRLNPDKLDDSGQPQGDASFNYRLGSVCLSRYIGGADYDGDIDTSPLPPASISHVPVGDTSFNFLHASPVLLRATAPRTTGTCSEHPDTYLAALYDYTRGYQGKKPVGLGLVGCKRLVEAQGGWIKLTSRGRDLREGA